MGLRERRARKAGGGTPQADAEWFGTWGWVVIAGAMYLSRVRRLRRAAIRGLMSLGATRFLLRLPPWRGRNAEEASLAAFSAGASLEFPAGALPLGILTATRVLGSGAPGRVGAAGVGASVAWGTTRVWPIPPREGANPPRVQLPAAAEPSEGGRDLTIVVNSASGPAGNGSPATKLANALPQARIVEFDPDEGGDLRAVLENAVDGSVALGISGGDGSINAAARVALDSEMPLMVIPSGTFNHMTEALGIESAAEAIDAVTRGEAVAVDVAAVGDKLFLNTASLGSYVELVDAREKLEGKLGRWLAVLVALMRVLRRNDPIEVEIDGEPHKIWMAFIGNCRYHPSGFAPSWRERLDDGLLDFRYISARRRWARVRLCLAVITGRLGRSKVYRQTTTPSLHISSREGPLRLALDGETFECPPDVQFEKLDRRLTVYAPHES